MKVQSNLAVSPASTCTCSVLMLKYVLFDSDIVTSIGPVPVLMTKKVLVESWATTP